MRAHVLGTGFVLGLAVTTFGAPGAWADASNETALFPATPGAAAPAQVSQVPRGAVESGARVKDADTGRHVVSVPMLALGIGLGSAAGASAIAWREVRR